jgi:hypothetical protein
MENESIAISIGFDKIRVALEKAADELFKSSYNNPVAEILRKSINEKESEVKKVIDEIIVGALTDPAFKSKMADVIIQRMVEGALKR